MLGVAYAVVLTACGTGDSVGEADIARVKDVRSSFGPEFTVTDVGPTGIDPRLLGPQALAPGQKFDPPDCASFADQQMVPAGAKGNMAATTAEGALVEREAGDRFGRVADGAEAAVSAPTENCRKVGFAGSGVRGLVEVVDAPQISEAQTLGTHRVVQTVVDGKPRTGEIYNYVAGFGTFLVIVTANPLVEPNKPVAPVDTQRARDLLTAAVAAVRD